MKDLGLQGFVLLLLMVTILALIYGLKYQEDVTRGKAKSDDYDRWWGMMYGAGVLMSLEMKALATKRL